MNLLDSGVNEKCRVVSVDLCEALKEHLHAMGVYPHATLRVKRFGWFKSSVQVQSGRRMIALGKEEARGIEISAA